MVKLSCSDEEAFVTRYGHDCYLHQWHNTKLRCGLAQIQEQEVKSGSKWETKVTVYIVELKNVVVCGSYNCMGMEGGRCTVGLE